MFDLRKRGKIGRVGLCGVNGKKFPAIRKHMANNIGEAYPASEYDLSCESWPSDSTVDPQAYETALVGSLHFGCLYVHLPPPPSPRPPPTVLLPFLALLLLLLYHLLLTLRVCLRLLPPLPLQV